MANVMDNLNRGREQVLRWMPDWIIGSVSFLGYMINTLFWTVLILVLALFKFILPFTPVRDVINRILNTFATAWISINNLNQRFFTSTRLRVEGLDQVNLKLNNWYLVLSNHQSWVDILILQRIFNRRIPFMKFFLKKELMWVPVLGQAWWALDFPFMKRYSRSFIEKNPHLKGTDFERTRRACDSFRLSPISIMNFVEGTRFTPAKHMRQESPYRHLLRPRAGGVALVLSAMGEQVHRILNVTIIYPQKKKTFWEFLSGKVEEVRVRVDSIAVGTELIGDYVNDMEFRKQFQDWLHTLWTEKDQYIEGFLTAEAFETAGGDCPACSS